MSERLYSDIVPMLSSSDPKVRRFAIEELTRHAVRFDRAGLLELCGNAAGDEDEDVARAGRWGLACLHRVGAPSRTGAVTGRHHLPSGAPPPDETELLELRRAAQDALTDVLGDLQAMALDPGAVELGELAIRLLGRFAFHDSLETLYKATRVEGRTHAALRAIGSFDEEEVLFLMRKFLRRFEDLTARGIILKVLAGLRFPEAMDLMEQHAASPSPGVRAAVAQSLCRRPEDRAEALLLRLLDDPEPEVVLTAIDSLAILGRAGAAKAVARFTAAEHDKRLRSRATAALGFLGAAEAVPILFRLLEDTDARVVANAVDALRSLDPSREDVIRHVGPLVNHPNNRVRANAILSLQAVEEGRAMASLRAMLASPMRLDRASAAWVVGEVGTVDAVKWLVTLINTELEPTVLSAALNALERIERPEARPALTRLFSHPNAGIRAQAVRVFSKTADSSGMRQLEGLLSTEKVQTVRSAVVAAMGNLSDSGNFMVVTRLLQDRNERVVANAIESLDRMASLEVTPFLTPFLSHPNNRIRANAVVALWKLGDLKAVRELHAMLVSPASAARRSAMHALRQVADFLAPGLLAERPLLRSSLRDRFRQRARDGSVGVTEVSRQYQELFRMEDELADTRGPREGSVGRLLRERARGDRESYETALADALTADPRAPFALFMARCQGGLQEGASAPGADDLRQVWTDARFAGGLQLMLERSKEQRDLTSVLGDYLALFEVHLAVYRDIVERSRNLLAAGDEGAVQGLVKFLVEKVPLQGRLHAEVGEAALAARDNEAAYDHLLRHVVGDGEDWAAMLKLCSAAVRRRDEALATAMLDVLLTTAGVPDEIRSTAERLRGLVAEGRS